MGRTTKTKNKAKMQSTIESRTDFFYYAFRNILLVGLPLLVISSVVLSSITSSVKADGRNTDSFTITIPTSCTIDATIATGQEHSATLNSGTAQANIGTTKMAAYCNDLNGYYIYAIGYGNNTDGNTNMVSSLGNDFDIATGTAMSGATSNWAMKLTGGTGTYAPYVVDNYRTYTSVPGQYDVVAYRESNTSMDKSALDTTGSYVETTYQAYVTSSQPAGTYTGQVKYTLIHPFDATKLYTIDTAFRIAGKDKARLIVNDNDSTDKQLLTNPETTIPSGYSLLGSYYTMQDMNSGICRLVTMRGEQTQAQLIDVRDYKTYWVAKLNDNNCWMTQNLDLDLSHEVALTSETSDIDPSTYGNGIYTSSAGYNQSGNVVSWTPSTVVDEDDGSGGTTPVQHADTKPMSWSSTTAATITGWTNNFNSPYSADAGDRYKYTNTAGTETVYTSLNDCLTGTNNDTAGCEHSHLGNYYNWSAAVASNNTNGASSSQTNSICPKNWNLPINGEYGTMLDAQDVWAGGTSTDYDTDGYLKIRTAPLYFVRSGLVNNGPLSVFTYNGYYWSSTVLNGSNSYHLLFYASNVNPANINVRGLGFPVRCMVSSS